MFALPKSLNCILIFDKTNPVLKTPMFILPLQHVVSNVLLTEILGCSISLKTSILKTDLCH